jgi:chromosome segregation ATPase
VARKEKERRAKVAKPVKVLTEDDGKEAATRGAGSVTALGGEGAAATAPAEHQSAGGDADAQRAAWKARADAARAAVVAAEKTLAQMERDVAAYRSDMRVVSAADAQDPMRLQKRDAKIVEMNKQVEAQKTAVADAKKAVAALEDEARRSGVPAGWLR